MIHDKWISTKGVPKSMLTDQGTDLTGEIMKHLCNLAGIKKLRTSPYHANTNGQVERWNSTLKKGLRVISTDHNLNFAKGDSWDLYIDLIVGHYNNSVSRRTGMSPNEIFYGNDIILPIDYNLGFDEFDLNRRNHIIYKGWIQNCKRMKHRLARDKLTEYDRKKKEAHDKDRIDHRYEIGDEVIYMTKYKKFGALGGIKTLWRGPYVVVDVYNDGINYRIRHLQSGKIKDVAVNKLQQYNVREDGNEYDFTDDEFINRLEYSDSNDSVYDSYPESATSSAE